MPTLLLSAACALILRGWDQTVGSKRILDRTFHSFIASKFINPLIVHSEEMLIEAQI